MLWDVFGAHVVGRVWGPCCGTSSGPMLWDEFGAHVVLHGHDVEMGVDAMGGGRKRFKFYALVITHLTLPHLGPEHIPLSCVARSCGHALLTSPRS